MLNVLLNEIAAQAGNKIDTQTANVLETYIRGLMSYIK